MVVDETGSSLDGNAPVVCSADVKAIYLGGCLTVVCQPDGGVFFFLTKDKRGGDDALETLESTCRFFETDNDLEECSGLTATCRNCLHRRWMSIGFACMREQSLHHAV